MRRHHRLSGLGFWLSCSALVCGSTLAACGGDSEADLFGQSTTPGAGAAGASAGSSGNAGAGGGGASGVAGKGGAGAPNVGGTGSGAGPTAGSGGSIAAGAGGTGASGAGGAGAGGAAGDTGSSGASGSAGAGAGAGDAGSAGADATGGTTAAGNAGAGGVDTAGAAGAAGTGEGGSAGSSAGSSGAGTAGAAGAPDVGCGNGVREGDEKCDGDDLGGVTCTSLLGGTNVGKLTCRKDCSFDTVQCGLCGNGILDAGEECEDGPDVASGRCKACKIVCPDSGKAFGGHCYSLVTGYKSWDDANKECVGKKAHLVSITSGDENKFVHEVLIGKQQFDPRTYWIGLSDAATEGTFVWTTNEPLGYKNWDNNEPNDFLNNEDCASLGTNNGKWNDERCSIVHQAVCEIDEPLKK
jgi:hypothetical protein